MEQKTRVMVVHGYCMLRDGLVDRLRKEPWIEVCAVSSALSQVPEMIFQYRPDLLLTSDSLQCASGMLSIKQLKRDFVCMKVLAFSCNSEFEDPHAGVVFTSGADGYISAADTPNELIDAIRKIMAGHQYFSPRVRRHKEQLKAIVPGFSALSQREAEVFCLTGCGYVTKNIAEMMDLKVKTVESYRERIRKKLNLTRGADLLYASVRFMRNIARWDAELDDRQVIREFLSATV